VYPRKAHGGSNEKCEIHVFRNDIDPPAADHRQRLAPKIDFVEQQFRAVHVEVNAGVMERVVIERQVQDLEDREHEGNLENLCLPGVDVAIALSAGGIPEAAGERE